MKKIIALILVMVLLAFGLTACKKAEQKTEEAAAKVEETAEKVEEKVEEAAEKAEEKVEEAVNVDLAVPNRIVKHRAHCLPCLREIHLVIRAGHRLSLPAYLSCGR